MMIIANALQAAAQIAPPTPAAPSEAAATSAGAERATSDNRRVSLQVRFDAPTSRYVQIWSDALTREALQQFPSESRLAFARGVRAYEAVLRKQL